MFQQINLYQPIFREEQKLFSATTICASIALVAAGLLSLALYSGWQVFKLERELKTLQAQQRVRGNLDAASARLFGQGTDEKALSDRVQALAVELDRRQQALRFLTSGEAALNRGFAARLAALAREQLEGLWLTGASFTADSGRLTLAGSAVSADLVPRYLARLANEPALAGAKFDSLEIRQPKSPAQGQVDFRVSSSSDAAAPLKRLAMAAAP
jgi:Tfp pilus assembly protein PilN